MRTSPGFTASPTSIKLPPAARTEIGQAPPMARKAFFLNETVREKVRHLAGVGVRQDDIAKIIGCAPKTLRKRCRDDLDRGVAEANAMVSGYLFANAKAGNVAGGFLRLGIGLVLLWLVFWHCAYIISPYNTPSNLSQRSSSSLRNGVFSRPVL